MFLSCPYRTCADSNSAPITDKQQDITEPSVRQDGEYLEMRCSVPRNPTDPEDNPFPDDTGPYLYFPPEGGECNDTAGGPAGTNPPPEISPEPVIIAPGWQAYSLH